MRHRDTLDDKLTEILRQDAFELTAPTDDEIFADIDPDQPLDEINVRPGDTERMIRMIFGHDDIKAAEDETPTLRV